MRKVCAHRRWLVFMFFIAVFCLSGCSTVYYNAMEKVGYHKRDIMVDRVRDARDSQEEAKEQFKSALEKFSTVMNFKGGDLEEKYNQLNDEYEASEKKAKAVRKRIEAVEDVSGALFDEWKEELKLYTNDTMRRNSEKKLEETKKQYEKFITAMTRAEKKIGPVLSTFRDQVLYLKHNLNARAIASIRGEMVSVEQDIASLIKEMEASIAEADAFIKSIPQS